MQILYIWWVSCNRKEKKDDKTGAVDTRCAHLRKWWIMSHWWLISGTPTASLSHWWNIIDIKHFFGGTELRFRHIASHQTKEFFFFLSNGQISSSKPSHVSVTPSSVNAYPGFMYVNSGSQRDDLSEDLWWPHWGVSRFDRHRKPPNISNVTEPLSV